MDNPGTVLTRWLIGRTASATPATVVKSPGILSTGVNCAPGRSHLQGTTARAQVVASLESQAGIRSGCHQSGSRHAIASRQDPLSSIRGDGDYRRHAAKWSRRTGQSPIRAKVPSTGGRTSRGRIVGAVTQTASFPSWGRRGHGVSGVPILNSRGTRTCSPHFDIRQGRRTRRDGAAPASHNYGTLGARLGHGWRGHHYLFTGFGHAIWPSPTPRTPALALAGVRFFVFPIRPRAQFSARTSSPGSFILRVFVWALVDRWLPPRRPGPCF